MASEMTETEKDALLAQDTGLESQWAEEDVLGQGSPGVGGGPAA